MSELGGLVHGLHHVTLVTGNQEINRRFYTEVLGLRRIKYTVNQDDIFHRHLFYGDEKGSTGSAVTFFEWPELPPGRTGISSPHHLAYTIPVLDALPMWKSWLLSHGVPSVGPLLRNRRLSLYLMDPDGATIELISPENEGLSPDDLAELDRDLPPLKEITSSMRLTRFHHASPITTDPTLLIRFFEKLLGLRSASTHPNPDQENGTIVSIGNPEHPDFLRYLAVPEASSGTVGSGSIHHIACTVEDEADQRRIMNRLSEAGTWTSGIVDRFWFRSLYFHDPEGNLLEVATRGPGYSVDEPPESLGSELILPPWLKSSRPLIEDRLREIDRRNEGLWPPKYPAIRNPPERVQMGHA